MNKIMLPAEWKKESFMTIGIRVREMLQEQKDKVTSIVIIVRCLDTLGIDAGRSMATHQSSRILGRKMDIWL